MRHNLRNMLACQMQYTVISVLSPRRSRVRIPREVAQFPGLPRSAEGADDGGEPSFVTALVGQ